MFKKINELSKEEFLDLKSKISTGEIDIKELSKQTIVVTTREEAWAKFIVEARARMEGREALSVVAIGEASRYLKQILKILRKAIRKRASVN